MLSYYEKGGTPLIPVGSTQESAGAFAPAGMRTPPMERIMRARVTRESMLRGDQASHAERGSTGSM